MSFFKIKLRKSDRLFRAYLLATRPHVCVRCGKKFQDTRYLHVSHFWGRGHENVRHDPENTDLLCSLPCHSTWGHGEERPLYEAYKIKQLGQDGFDRLMLRAHLRKKRDDKLDVFVIEQMIEELKV